MINPQPNTPEIQGEQKEAQNSSPVESAENKAPDEGVSTGAGESSREKQRGVSDERRGGEDDRSKRRGGRGGGGGGGGRGGRGRGRGRGEKEEKEFEEEVLDIARVTRVVKGGRRMRFRATVIIGDRKGRVGLGTGKANEVSSGVQKAVADAKKHLIRVPIENGTVPHELTFKFKSARILLMPAKEGTGIIAGGALRKIADLAGIDNILGKSYGTSNTLVNAQAMMKALSSFRSQRITKRGEEKAQEAKNAGEPKS